MHGSVSLQLFPVVWIFLRFLGVICSLFQQMSSQCESQTLLQGLVSHELTVYLSVFDQFLTHQIMVILSKGCKPGNFESHNSLKLSFTHIQGRLCSNFVKCKFFFESNSPDILPISETNLDNSIDSDNFSMRGYLSLTLKNSITQIHGLAVYVKEGLHLAPDMSAENSADSYLYFLLTLLQVVSYFIFL